MTYESFVYIKGITKDLRFPPICAYCNRPTALDDTRDGPLKVPHCSEHAKITGHNAIIIHSALHRIKKPQQTNELRQINKPRRYAPVILSVIAGTLVGIYFYSRDLLVFRELDPRITNFVLGLTAFIVASALFYALELLILNRFFSQADKKDQFDGVDQIKEVDQTEEVDFSNTEAVKISQVYTGKYAGAYLWCFHSKTFADEFARLNSNFVVGKHDVKPGHHTQLTEQVRYIRTSHDEIHPQGMNTTATGPATDSDSKRLQDMPGVQPIHPLSSEDMELVAERRQNLRRKVMRDEATIDRLIDYERRLNPTASLVELIQAAIDRWERDNR